MKYLSSILTSRFSKFAFVGALNTAVDLIVLNALIYTFNVSGSTTGYIVCKAISFSVAVVHSYFWNKYWVFRSVTGSARSAEAPLFLLVSILGLIINTVVSSAFFHVSSGIVPEGYAFITVNLSALIGTLAVLLWNFFGYSRFAFKK